MHYTTLGRTQLNVSIAGLGGGGHSRLGLSKGKTLDDALAVARHAYEQGVNVFDTAQSYRTEPVIAKLLDEVPREKIVISTKAGIGYEGVLKVTPQQFEQTIDERLIELNTDYLDIMYIHGLHPDLAETAVEVIVPVMQKAREKGKIRFLGVTEMFEHDFTHRMLQRVLPHVCFDVVMLGFNILNQTARDTVLPQIQKQNVGTMAMFAIREVLSKPDRFQQTISQIIADGKVDPSLINPDNPLDFLIHDQGHADIIDACYRFVRDEPGINIVLTGTSRIEHLTDNLRSINGPTLETDIRQRLIDIFKHVDNLSGN